MATVVFRGAGPSRDPPRPPCRVHCGRVAAVPTLMFALLPDAVDLRRRHHDGDDGEETHSVPGDQSSPAAREEPVQTGQHAHPAQLEEETAAALLCPAHCHRPRTRHGVLGYGHLRHTHTMMKQPSGHAHHTDALLLGALISLILLQKC